MRRRGRTHTVDLVDLVDWQIDATRTPQWMKSSHGGVDGARSVIFGLPQHFLLWRRHAVRPFQAASRACSIEARKAALSSGVNDPLPAPCAGPHTPT